MRRMFTGLTAVALAASLMSTTACSSNMGRGAIIGAATGAAVGAAVVERDPSTAASATRPAIRSSLPSGSTNGASATNT